MNKLVSVRVRIKPLDKIIVPIHNTGDKTIVTYFPSDNKIITILLALKGSNGWMVLLPYKFRWCYQLTSDIAKQYNISNDYVGRWVKDLDVNEFKLVKQKCLQCKI